MGLCLPSFLNQSWCDLKVYYRSTNLDIVTSIDLSYVIFQKYTRILIALPCLYAFLCIIILHQCFLQKSLLDSEGLIKSTDIVNYFCIVQFLRKSIITKYYPQNFHSYRKIVINSEHISFICVINTTHYDFVLMMQMLSAMKNTLF